MGLVLDDQLPCDYIAHTDELAISLTRACRPSLEMNARRDVLRLAASGGLGWLSLRLTACGGESEEVGRDGARLMREAADAATDAADGGDAAPWDAGDADAADARDAREAGPTVTLYDTNAQALYYDGSYGPFTGIVRVSYVLANAPLTLDFWHGHGGHLHRWTLTQAHFAELKRLRRVTLETTEVEGHAHQLFVDPVGLRWRVPGAPPIAVPT